MDATNWFLYISAVLIATGTPGPAVIYIMSNSAEFGLKHAFYIATGNIFGLLILSLLSIIGIELALSSSDFWFLIIRYLGGVYLIYLGILMLKKSFSKNNTSINTITYQAKPNKWVLFRSVGIALSNPKAIIFLLALFPQFIDVNKPLISQYFLLIIILTLSSFSFLMFYAILAERSSHFLLTKRKISIFTGLSGFLFVVLGVVMLIFPINKV